MTRQEAIDIARKHAYDYHSDHSYTPKTEAERDVFDVHTWVIEAIEAAYEQGGYDEYLAYRGQY